MQSPSGTETGSALANAWGALVSVLLGMPIGNDRGDD